MKSDKLKIVSNATTVSIVKIGRQMDEEVLHPLTRKRATQLAIELIQLGCDIDAEFGNSLCPSSGNAWARVACDLRLKHRDVLRLAFDLMREGERP